MTLDDGHPFGVLALYLALFVVLVALSDCQPAQAAVRWHQVALADMATTRWTHVCTRGTVVYRRRMADGDWHVTLEARGVKLVAEIIPQIPLDPPAKGQRVEVCGIARIDRHHGWPEVHPVTHWRAL